MGGHAVDRAAERYNRELTRYDLSEMRKLILNGKRILLQVVREGSALYLLKYKNLPMKVLYNMETARVVTIYPLDIDECNTYLEQLNKLYA